jgi:hypothetical protein
MYEGQGSGGSLSNHREMYSALEEVDIAVRRRTSLIREKEDTIERKYTRRSFYNCVFVLMECLQLIMFS